MRHGEAHPPLDMTNENGNGITVTKSQISFWATTVVAIITVGAAWYGASRPVQPESSSNNQQQILANQAYVMQQVGKVDNLEANQKTMIANQKILLDKLEGLEKKVSR